MRNPGKYWYRSKDLRNTIVSIYNGMDTGNASARVVSLDTCTGPADGTGLSVDLDTSVKSVSATDCFSGKGTESEIGSKGACLDCSCFEKAKNFP